MVRMTHLIWRNGRAYFRYRLPPELRAIPKPKHWPTELDELVSESSREKLKHELSRALGTRDEREAKRRAAVEVARVEGVIQQAREFLLHGPKKVLSAADIRLTAERYGVGLIVSDMDLRKAGIGLRLPTPGRSLAIRLGTSSPQKLVDRSEPGLTTDDLGLLRFAISQIKPEVSDALARQRPTPLIKEAVRKALGEAGIELEAGCAELRELELAFLAEYAKALDVWETRNAGRLVPNPVIPDVRGKVPTIQSAFESWKTGTGTRGESLPAMGAVEEASHAVRRFVELHGNLFVSDITAAHARAFRDAVAKVPPRLPLALQKLPLPKLIEAKNLPPGRPSAATVNKKLTLLAAVLHKAVRDHGLKAGWHNPFEGLKIQETRSAKNRRSSFNTEDLKSLLAQPFMREGNVATRGGKGLAARWLPLLAMFTGARRRELTQLKLADVLTEDGITYLRIIDTEEGQSVKVSGSIRRVPLHPELLRCGFLHYVEQRRRVAKPEDWLFADLEVYRKGDRGDAWGRWFGRQLEVLGIDAAGRKVFHSFRHTFIARCREAEIEEEYRFALTGHSDGGLVGRGYGGDESGFRHSLQRLHKEICKIGYPGVDLSHLYVA